MEFEPVTERPQSPPVWYWYVFLCVLLAVSNFALMGLGFWMLGAEQELMERTDYPPNLLGFYSGLFILCGIVFGIGNLILPFLPKKPWIYVLHMTNIVAAGATCCLLPLAIPVFVFWLKPDIREMFEFR